MRQVVTAREQYEMLTPWRAAAVDSDEYDFRPDQYDYHPPSGPVTLYHRTWPEHADEIVRQQRFRNAEDDPIYFSTHPNGNLMGTRYGPAAVKVRLPADRVRFEPSHAGLGPDDEVHGYVWPQDLAGVPIERHI